MQAFDMSNKSIYRSIWEAISGEERIRVAVLGSKGSGKTVFLTALANHLLNHDPLRCPLNGWTVTPVERDLTGDACADGIPLYQYADARRSLAAGEWPRKTKDWSVLRLALQLRNKKRRRDVLLEVLDLPGERVADFPMIGRSYRDWCEWMGHSFGGVFGASDHYKDYCAAAAGATEQQELYAAYRRFLAAEHAACSLSLTPSIVKLGRDAVFRTGDSGEAFFANIADVPLGLDAEQQFVPLPPTCFKADAPCRKWLRSFERSYDAYRRAIVDPIGDWLRDVNQLFYFVDVLGLLQRGPDVYNAEKAFGAQALRMFARPDSSNGLVRGLQRLLDTFLRTRVDGATVVATKADLVLSEENRSHMKNLARRMFGNVLMSLGLDARQTEVLSCAAVKTTDEYGREKALGARLDGMSGELTTYLATDVPDDWPDSAAWGVGDARFDFQPTFPRFDRREDRAPAHLGLQDLLVRMLYLQR